MEIQRRFFLGGLQMSYPSKILPMRTVFILIVFCIRLSFVFASHSLFMRQKWMAINKFLDSVAGAGSRSV